jgi:hypothetical protein
MAMGDHGMNNCRVDLFAIRESARKDRDPAKEHYDTAPHQSYKEQHFEEAHTEDRERQQHPSTHQSQSLNRAAL